MAHTFFQDPRHTESNCVMCGLPKNNPRHKVGNDWEYHSVWDGKPTMNTDDAMNVGGTPIKFSKSISKAERAYMESE